MRSIRLTLVKYLSVYAIWLFECGIVSFMPIRVVK